MEETIEYILVLFWDPPHLETAQPPGLYPDLNPEVGSRSTYRQQGRIKQRMGKTLTSAPSRRI